MLKTKVITIVILVLCICGACAICNAMQTGSVYLESNKNNVEKDEEIEITVNLSGNETAAFNILLNFDDAKWEYISDIESANVENGNILYVWYDEAGGSNAKQGELIKLKFKAKENGLSTFNISGEFYNSSGQQIEADFKEMQVQIGKEDTTLELQSEEEKGSNTEKNNSYLQSLRLDIEGISPEFDKNIYEYYITVPTKVKDLEVLAISENPNATINITGNERLKNGSNTIKIEVISEDKSTNKVYNIYVTRTDNAEEANANLEILAIENTLLTPPFDANETRYETEVPNDTEKLNIFAVPENENAKIEVTGGSNLKEGDNNVIIAVTAENGYTVKEYKINVHKRNEKEQIEYQQEQEEQKEKLEEAYEIEKLSADEEKANSVQEGKEDKETEEKTENIIFTIIGTIISILVLGFTIYRIIKEKKWHE